MAIDYSSILNNATAAYNASLQGYRDQLHQQQQAQARVVQGYNDLQAGVLGGLEESSAVAGKLISDRYAQQGAQQQMQLFRQGLGNSTVRNNLQNQLTRDSSFAQTDRLAKYGTIAADKRTQLGLAGLGYAGNAIRDNMQFAGQGLQYQGQGAFQLGGLALNTAEAQQRASQFDRQFEQQRMNQLYGTGRGGGGGGGISSYDGKPFGGMTANRDSMAGNYVPNRGPATGPYQPYAASGGGGGGFGDESDVGYSSSGGDFGDYYGDIGFQQDGSFAGSYDDYYDVYGDTDYA